MALLLAILIIILVVVVSIVVLRVVLALVVAAILLVWVVGIRIIIAAACELVEFCRQLMLKLTIRHSIRHRLVDDLGGQHILLGRRSILGSGRLDNRSRC